MCGIAGSINFSLSIPVLTQSLFHRGPDEQTTFKENNLILHHHRLSILDIEGGKQPMTYQHLTIIFNGEIYNHNRVRSKYRLTGRTHSDTETILLAYDKLGSDCLNEFDGMFAMAIYDRNKNEIFLARDRAGKKPLYYYLKEDQFVFASELNALKGQLSLEVNNEHIQQYLRLGYFYKTATPYLNVSELPAGSFATVSLSKPEIRPIKWWSISKYYNEKSNDDLAVSIEKVDSILTMAVNDRLDSSDLEVGSFLSGGIDSGIVTAIAAKHKPSLKTFTVSFDGEYDEAPLARLVAERYNTHHHEIRISFTNLFEDVEKILSNYGEPFFDDSAIPSYYVSKAAKEHLTVILNGDGGDELFGGYRRYVPFSNYDFFNSGLAIKGLARLLYPIMPVSHNRKSKYNYLYRLTDLARKNKLSIYLSSTIDCFEGYEKYFLGDTNYINQIENDFEEVNNSSLSGLRKIMCLDFDNILACNLLVKMDIATMSHSLEGRSPLLSKEILEYAPTIPDKYKVKGIETKYLLRRLAEKYLPAELINQPKRGFEPPLKKWVNDELRSLIGDYIISDTAFYPDFIDKDFVLKLFDNNISVPSEKRAKMLWLIFALEVWNKKVYKQS